MQVNILYIIQNLFHFFAGGYIEILIQWYCRLGQSFQTFMNDAVAARIMKNKFAECANTWLMRLGVTDFSSMFSRSFSYNCMLGEGNTLDELMDVISVMKNIMETMLYL